MQRGVVFSNVAGVFVYFEDVKTWEMSNGKP